MENNQNDIHNNKTTLIVFSRLLLQNGWFLAGTWIIGLCVYKNETKLLQWIEIALNE